MGKLLNRNNTICLRVKQFVEFKNIMSIVLFNLFIEIKIEELV